MKRKLLFAALCVVGAMSFKAHAQTDVTSTYITNPGFEGEYQRFLNINNDRGVEKPVGWSVEWTQSATNDQNGMTFVGSMTQDNKTWSAHGGSKAYFTRMRWANATLNLRQTMTNLRPGSYTLSFFATASKLNGGDGSASVSVAGQSQSITVGTSEDTNWTQYSINFTVTDSNPYATIEVTASRTAGNFKFGIDSFTLTYDGSSYYNTLLDAAQSLHDDNKDWAEGAEDLSAAITAATGKESVADKNDAIVALEEAMATFKENNTVDVTSRITNATFDSNITGWTCTGGDGNAYQRQTSSQNNFDGGFLEKWRNGWTGAYNQKNFDVYQTLSNLPNGEYTIKAAIIAVMQGSAETFSANNTAYSNKKHGGPYYIDDEKGVWLYGNSGENSGKAWANTKNPNFDGDGAEYKTATVKVENGSLTIGFKGIGSESGGTSLGTYANWIACDNWTLSYFGFDPTTLKGQITSLKEDAAALLSNTDYENVTGSEKTALTTASHLEPADEKKSTLEAAIAQIEEAIANFTAAKTNYDALVAEIAKAKALGIDDDTAEGYAATSSSTAATALANTQYLKVAEYEYITTTYTESATLGAWTEDFAQDLSNEGYKNDGPKYFNEWGNNTRTAKQTVKLPAGDYAVSCIARGATGTSGYLYYKIGEADAVTTDFNMKNNRGKGVDTNGVANFSDEGTYTCNGEGFGWEYRFLTFTLGEATDVEIGVSATFDNNWVSIYAPQLFTTEASVKKVRLAEIAEALGTVPTGNMNKEVKTTLDTKKETAENATDNNTKEELATIHSELNTAIDDANASIAEYEKISNYLTISSTSFEGDYSTIANAIENGDYTDYSDGMAAVKACRNSVATTNMSANKDLTGLIDNNSFETGTTDFWSTKPSSDTGARKDGDYRMSNMDGSYVFNTWWQGTPITQNIGTLPAGAYELKGVVASDGGTVYITVNDTHEAYVETAAAKGVGIEFSYVFTLDEEKEVTIGLVGGANGTVGAHKDYSENGYWFYKADNFRLTYLGETAPENTIDGTYHFSTGSTSLARGGDSGTEAIMSDDGIAMTITTDKAGISTLQMVDTERFLMWNNSMVYTDGTIDPAKTHHQPYWKVKAVEGGYQILNTESGLYLSTTTATRNEEEITVVTCTAEPATWTLTAFEPDYTELATAISAAEGHSLGFEKDEYAPYNNVDALAKLAAAKELNEKKNAASQAVIDAAETALSEATWTDNDKEVNAIFDGYFASTYSHDGNVMPIGWHGVGIHDNATDVRLMWDAETNAGLNAATNKQSAFAKFTATYGTETGYTMPLKAGVYTLKFIYGGWNETATREIRIYSGETNATLVSESTITAKDNKAHTTADSWKTYSGKFIVPEDGDYVLSFYRENTTSQNQLIFSDIEIFSVPEAEVTMSITSVKWATFIAPFDVTLPDDVDVTAYSIDEIDGTTIRLVSEFNDNTIPANTPVLLYSENPYSKTFCGQDVHLNETYSDTNGFLTGVLVSGTKAPVGSYVMQNHSGKVGFYKVDGDKQPTMTQYRAYLNYTAPDPNEAKPISLSFDDDEATAIAGFEALTSGNMEGIYTTSGTKVNSLQKGVNIIRTKDGKNVKVYVK